MKAYLITTGIIFTIITGLHIWKVIAEWPQSGASAAFMVGMAALIAVPALLACWAWRLVARFPDSK
jgi:hypothetical protein